MALRVKNDNGASDFGLRLTSHNYMDVRCINYMPILGISCVVGQKLALMQKLQPLSTQF